MNGKNVIGKNVKKTKDKIVMGIQCERCKGWKHVSCIELTEIDSDAIFVFQ